jgi:hypothetical protein
MDRLIADLDILRQQIEAALENATQGARESHQSWTTRLETAEEIGAELSSRGKEEVQEERRREMLCLGQAAGLAWVGMRLGQIVGSAELREGEAEGPRSRERRSSRERADQPDGEPHPHPHPHPSVPSPVDD